MRIGSLFSGAGGLDMAVEEVFGGEVIWHSEIDKAASKVLEFRFPGVPNLGDITEINWANWKPMLAVDVLCGGFPCQDVSAAGKRAGIKDGTRSGLWAVFADAIDALRPQWVVIENVRGLLSATAHRAVESDDATLGDRSGRPVLRAAGAVLGDLADLGYDAQWTTFAASSVGAPHRRERVFILAHADPDEGRWGGRRETSRGDVGGHDEIDGRRGSVPASGCGGPVADASGDGWDEGRPELARLKRGFDAAVRSDGHVELLPTPAAGNFNDGEDVDGWLTRREEVKERLNNGNGMGMPLSIAVQLLPTPQAHDSQGPKTAEQVAAMRDRGYGVRNLNETAVHELFPTPNASDGSGGGQHPDKREGHSRQLIDYILLCTPTAEPGSSPFHEPESGWGKYADAIHRWEQIVGPAPAPTEPNKNGNPRLNPAFSEWMMGWPAGWVTDPDIGISRNDQLRIVGNGVCPQQATAALRYLLSIALNTPQRGIHAAAETPVLLPTPCARDYKDGEFPASHARNTPSLGAVSAYFGEDV